MFDFEFCVNALIATLFFIIAVTLNLADVGFWVQATFDGTGLVSCLAIGELVRAKRDK